MIWTSILGARCLAAGLAALPALAGRQSVEDVGRAIAARRERVAEFQLIKEAAVELGIRVWLFGGTAAGFAHYVRWDLAREGGDERDRESFFDYDFTNIYRSTQDADLVVDATPEQAAELENLVRQKMSFLQGSKEHWEVRLLRRDRAMPNGQVKQALLANPDFLRQHTDSNSTGMIELTDPPPGEGVVRDLRDWDSAEPFFLQDVTAGRLHYYWSPEHQTTTRFREGHNPPLFSVIRYLVKAFQYGLTVEGEDLRTVKGIIDAFDPAADHAAMSEWAQGWLERYAPNLIRHAVDVEYAWNTLEELGLRSKLVSLSQPSRELSLGWWLSREPLRTGPVGGGSGRTAAELGIEVVAHETSDFLAYESITRDMTGRPNVLISRPGHPGETAALGPGFYTLQGRKGARDTGLTIRFTVDPAAREGADFTAYQDGRVLFTNRAALRVIPESLDASMLQYFEMLRDGLVDRSDRGAWTKLRRRLSLRPLKPEEEGPIVAIVRGEIERVLTHGGPSPILTEWFALPAAQSHPELVDYLRAAVEAGVDRWTKDRGPLALLQVWFDLPASATHPLGRRQIEKLVGFASGMVDRYARHREGWRYWIVESAWRESMWEWLRLPLFKDHPEVFNPLIERRSVGRYDLTYFPRWMDDPRLLLSAVSKTAQDDDEGGGDFHAAEFDRALQQPQWRQNPRLRALCEGEAPTAACLKRAADLELLAPEPSGSPSLLEFFRILQDGRVDPNARGAFARLKERVSPRALTLEEEADLVALLSEEIDRVRGKGSGKPVYTRDGAEPVLLREWFALPLSASHPEVEEKLYRELSEAIDAEYPDQGKAAWGVIPLGRAWFHSPASRVRLDLLERLIDRFSTQTFRKTGSWGSSTFDSFLDTALRLPGWAEHPEVFDALLERGMFLEAVHILDDFSHHQWDDHPEVVLDLIDRLPEEAMNRAVFEGFVKTRLFWENPEILRKLLSRGGSFPTHVADFLNRWGRRNSAYVRENPELVLALLDWVDATYPSGREEADGWFDSVLAEHSWTHQARLRELCGGADPEAACLRSGLQRERLEGLASLPHLSAPAEECGQEP